MRRLVFVLSLALFCVRLPAQEVPVEAPPAPVPTPAPNRVLFSVFVWNSPTILREDSVPAGIPRTFYDAPTGIQMLRLRKNSSTPLMPYEGPQPLTLYDVEDTWVAPPPEAPPGTRHSLSRKRVPLIRATFAPGLDRIILVVFPDRKAPDGTLQTLVIPYDSAQLQPGMARIYNGTNEPLALTFADEENASFRLEPNKPFDFRPGDITRSTYPRVFVHGVGKNKELQFMHTNKLLLKEKEKNIFIVSSHGGHRVQLLRLGSFEDVETDSLFPPPAPTPAIGPTP